MEQHIIFADLIFWFILYQDKRTKDELDPSFSISQNHPQGDINNSKIKNMN
jgi:hypothetical protein